MRSRLGRDIEIVTLRSGISIKRSAGNALIWGVAFNLGRDIIQFGSMLILVRLLSPEVYGQFALAQTLQLFLAVISIKAITPFALQTRDPESFDWDLQFTAGAILNTAVFIISLMLAGTLWAFGTEATRAVGAVLAFMALVFPAEIIGTHYFNWLQANHLWKRMRLLLFGGTFLGTTASIIFAMAGGGVFALAVGNVFFVLPMIVDYVVRRPFSIKFQPERLKFYREGRNLGINRAVSGALQNTCNLVEQLIISSSFGFAILGIYTRSVGLAQITSGRIGPVVIQTLYPVLSRAEASSERFRQYSGTLLQGIIWTSVPAATFLWAEAGPIVQFLYGEKWLAVTPLLGAAALLLAMRGLHLTMNQIMLANLQQKWCLRLDWVGAISMLVVIVSTASYGPKFYLAALAVHAALVFLVTSYFAVKGGAISAAHTIRVTGSCAVAVLIGIFVTAALPRASVGGSLASIVLSLAAHGVLFAAVYILVLRLVATSAMITLIEAIPLPRRLQSSIYLFLNLRKAFT